MFFRVIPTLTQRRYVFQLLASGLLLVCASLMAFGQGGVGSTRGLPNSSGGIHIIQGRVHFPVEPKAGRRVKVRLTSTDLMDQSAVTNEDGSFIFNRLPAGHYRLIVDAGSEFDVANETVNIDREASIGGRNMNVAINLKLRGSAAAFAKIPKEAREFYTKGTEAASKGENKKAAELLSKALAVHPDFPEALTELGLQYMKLGEMSKAAETYAALMKLKPGDATTHMNLGIALYNQSTALLNEKKADEANQKLAQSEQHLRDSLKLNSSGPTAHYYLGLIHIRQRKLVDAQKEMELAIANGGENLALAHKYLGGLYMTAKRNKEAADELEKYLALDPKAKDGDQIRTTIKELRAKP